MTAYRTGSVTSADGTTIGYRFLGTGPSLILVHGGMQAAQHLMKLATALSSDFTVYLPDRRGRGLSGPHGAGYGIEREVDDIRALAAATGAVRAFGLSSGGLVVLRAALSVPFQRIAAYEPPLSVAGSAPVAWLPRYDREIVAGRPAAALVTALKGMGTEPMFARIPRFLLVPLLSVGLRFQRSAPSGDVPIPDLVPTQHYDLRLVRELSDTADDFAALEASVLLVGGSASPAWLTVGLTALVNVIPRVQRMELPGLGHSGPDDDGDPAQVATVLREFFTTAG
jgi:pimeloyl-ACP methyl ester carboxylesterase